MNLREKILSILIFVMLGLSIPYLVPSVSLAHLGHDFIGVDSTDEAINKLKDQESKKKELEQKISNARLQEKTLANQISYLENQIELTQIQQAETIATIVEVQNLLSDVSVNIEGLIAKLSNLDSSITDLYDVLSKRIRSTYQVESAVGTDLLLDSPNLRQAVLQLAYLQSLQREDNKLLEKMSGTKDVYNKQRQELESLKTEKEDLRNQLEVYNQVLEAQKVDLSSQQSSKAWLLSVTKSEEQEYQRLLAQVEEEIRAIRVALTSAGTKLGDVQAGDIIGYVGNTGCSTGAHLHFGFYIGGVAVDPWGYFQNGSFRWPLASPYVTQYFNDPNTRSWYQANFGMSGHNGVDFVDEVLGPGAPILAVKEGVAYSVSDSKPCYLTGTVGKGVRIDHPDGTKTIYWHLK